MTDAACVGGAIAATTVAPKITHIVHEHITKLPSKPTEPITTTISVIDSIGNNSFDSPDLEVKGYMDDSCSSFSSLDSIDRGNDLNTSMSSMESYEILGDTKSTATLISLPKPIATTATKTLLISSIESPDSKTESSSSSLEASTCSNDSIYGSQELPVLKVSSNEGTLTNSPTSPCCGESATLADKEGLTKPEEKRVRKTSWMGGKGDSVYPATLDKLMSIFQHPSNLFFTNRSDVAKKEPPVNQENKPPSRKESPMGGLFAWSKKENSPEEHEFKPITEPILPNLPKITKSPLQPNVSPENTITDDAVAIDTMPIKLVQEMKENISPEHTVTATSVANLQTPAHNSPIAVLRDKVRFEVGGNDDEDDDDDDDNDDDDNNASEGHPEDSVKCGQSSVGGSSPIRHPQIGVIGKTLGQITRDSMSILKGAANNSQDSIRSLESLSEIVYEEQLPQ